MVRIGGMALTVASLLTTVSSRADELPIKVVKIGSAAPLSGGIAHLGQDNQNGAQLAIDEINAQGSLVIEGQKIKLELIGEDDAGDPKLGLSVAQKLVDAHVVAVVGHLNSGVSIPANRVYADAGIVQVSPSSTNPDYTLKGDRTPKGYVSSYRLITHDGKQGSVLARYLLEKGARSILILDDATLYGKSLGDQIEDSIKNDNIRLLGREAATDKVVSFKRILTRYKAYKPQYIFWGGMDDVAAALAKQIKEMGMTATLVSGDGACTDKFIELSGRAAAGMTCVQTGQPLSTMAKGEEFSKNYQNTFYGKTVQIYSPYAYDAVYSIVNAMKIANSTDREAIAAAMPKVDFEGVTGRIRFDQYGDIKNGAVTLFQVRHGQLKDIAVMRVP